MIPTTINGRWDLLLPEHRAWREEWKTGWETERLASMYANLQPGDVVVDVGTEEGDISALLAQWVNGPQLGLVQDERGWDHTRELEGAYGGVILMEPNPKVWPNVKAIFQANDLPDPLGWWVGFASSQTKFGVQSEQHNGNDQPWPACADGELIGNHGFCNLSERPDIDEITLDDLCTAVGVVPNAITMDTEGSELRVLYGAERILAEHRPLVWVSVHPQFSVDMYGLTRDNLDHFMLQRGYRSELLAIDHEHHVVYHHPEGRQLVDWR